MNQHRRTPEDALIAKEGQEVRRLAPRGCPVLARMWRAYRAVEAKYGSEEAKGWCAARAHYKPPAAQPQARAEAEALFDRSAA